MNLTQFFTDILEQTAHFAGGNYGWAIILVTLAIRSALLPLVLPSLKSQKKIQALKPEIDKLKKKYQDDKEKFAKKQMALYQKHGVNPLGGCLPQLVQIGLFIVFYRVLINLLNNQETLTNSVEFLWLNLTQPDSWYILPVITALTQFVLGIMILPATSTQAEKELAAKTKTNKDDEQATDMEAMAKTMQSQMVFVMPFVIGFTALTFPSGLALYWVTSTLFSIGQQYAISGWGGLTPRLQKAPIINQMIK